MVVNINSAHWLIRTSSVFSPEWQTTMHAHSIRYEKLTVPHDEYELAHTQAQQ